MNAGAVTWGDGSQGTVGVVSSGNSLVGGVRDARVGSGGAYALSNGNYVVNSRYWGTSSSNTGMGASTWVDGSNGNIKGTTSKGGTVSSSNSLVGSIKGDYVGGFRVYEVGNSNYVVLSPYWNYGFSNTAFGAATWANGTTVISGAVSSSNSLVGRFANSCLGSGGITVLNNANKDFVLRSPEAKSDDGAKSRVGAVTWMSGTAGLTGKISSSNSLVGTTANDCLGSRGVIALDNGNYVVLSPIGIIIWRITAQSMSAR